MTSPTHEAEPPLLETGNPPRKQWTRDECRQMMEIGILEEARFELIHRDIIPKMAQPECHVFTHKQVQGQLEDIFGRNYMRLANPVAIGRHEEPEPDAAVMRLPMIDYLRMGTPLPTEVRLCVEVSDSTLNWDLRVKSGQYGSAGIQEYWVVDIPNRRLHVFREPNGSGYASETVLTTEDEVSPLAAPDAAVHMADLLP